MQATTPLLRLLLRVSLRPVLGLLLLIGLYSVVAGVSLHANAAANATLTVTDCSGETGPGRIGTVISSASVGDTITFSCSGFIPFTSPLVITTNNLTLDGSGQTVALSGQGFTALIFVNTGVTFNINALSIANGFNRNYLGGGGLFSNLNSTVNISNSTFIDNVSLHGNGGGIDNEGTMNISNSTFINNSTSSNNGGAFSNEGTLSISNNTIVNNSSAHDGGGFYNWDGTISISNSTIAHNSSVNGGGIDDFIGTVSFNGSIVAENTAQQGNDCYNPFGGPFSDNGYNLESGSDCGFTGTGSLQNTNPQFDPNGLQNNGGPTRTVALEPDSPGVDHIPVGSSCPSTDQRGVSRPQGSLCDIGAFEMTTADGLSVMIDVVNSFQLNNATRVTLDGELQTALAAVSKGAIKVACASLQVFSGEVKLRTGHDITSSEATQLLNEAMVIENRVGC